MTLSMPANEAKRLAVLAECEVLDTPAESPFSDIVALAARLCDTPIAAISLVDANRTWFKAVFGLSLNESPRAATPCAYAILEPARVMEIEDTHRDSRFENFDLGFRFYAGMPIVTHDNFALGTLCVLDTIPRRLDPEQKQALGTLAQAVTGLLELRRASSLLGQMKADRRAEQTALRETDQFSRRIVEASRDCIKLLDLEGHLLFVNAGGMRELEICDLEPFIGRQWLDFWKGKDREAASQAVESARKGKVGSFTGFLPTLSGQPRQWEVVVSPILGTGNQPVRLLAISREIAGHKGVELKEAQVRLQHVLAVCPAIIYTTQASGDYACTFVSENIQQILGYTQQEMLDDPDFWTAHLHPQDTRRVLAEVFRLIPQGGGDLEYRFRHRDGHYRWFQDSFKTIYDEADRPLEIVGSWADITERKRGENLLAAQEDILERVAAGTLLTESLDALARFVEHEDGEGRCSILLLNDDGKTIGHVAGPGLPSAYKQAIEGISIGPSVGSCGTAMYRRRPVKVADIASDPLWENYKDLALAHGLRACFSIPIFGGGDQVLGSFAFYYDSRRDISPQTWELMAQVSALAGAAISRSRSERNLRDNEAHQHAILSSALDAVITMDHHGKVLEFNHSAEQIFGYSREQAVGSALADLVIPPNLRAAHHRGLARYLESGKAEVLGKRIEITAMRKDGSEFPVELSVLRLPGSEPPVFTGFLRDISQRREAQRALAEQKDRLARVIETMAEGVFVISVDGRYEMVNAAGEEMVGLPRDKIVGIAYESPPWKRFNLDGSLFPIAAHPFNQTRKKDQPVTGIEFIIETLVGKQTIVSANATPLRDESGKFIGMLATLADISERKRAEAALKGSQERLRLAVAAAQLSAWEWDIPRDLVRWTLRPQANHFGRLVPLEAAFQRVLPADRDTLRSALTSAVRTRTPLDVEYRIESDRGVRWIAANGLAYFDERGQPVRMLGVTRDVTGFKESQLKLEQLANYDLLTELPNRNLFYDRLQRGIARAARDKAKVAIMFVDFDNFKVVNDGLGHHIGDRLLGMIAERLSRCVREEDTVARWGGDEFTVILERASDPADVAHTAQRIAEELSTPFQLDAHEIFITASVGISFFPDDAADLNSLVKHADLAMFQAKAQARGSYRFFSPDMNTRATERLHIEANLRRALERDELVVHYQPQVCFRSGRIAGVEALVRWRHSKWGLMGPDRFIPIAEQSGLIVPLGEWVLEQACRQMREWEREGLPPMSLAVNLSARQFRQKDIWLMIRKTLERCGFSASRLEIELTESAIMDDVEAAARVLAEIRATGVNIAIDDFGKGYSSLAYLKRFPLDKLKIDHDFVRDVASDPDDAAIVNAIITLAHSLEIGVVAEGVETEEQLKFLTSQGCDQGQGYYFGKPAPAHEIAARLMSRERPRKKQKV
ncbi:MAG: EAL domain-containing protein [Burkholderiales bacterium]